MAPDLWMKGTRMKLNCSKCLLNIANSKSFLLLTLPVHHEYFSHLELPAGATPEEQFLYNLKEKTKFKLIFKKKKKRKENIENIHCKNSELSTSVLPFPACKGSQPKTYQDK